MSFALMFAFALVRLTGFIVEPHERRLSRRLWRAVARDVAAGRRPPTTMQ